MNVLILYIPLYCMNWFFCFCSEQNSITKTLFWLSIPYTLLLYSCVDWFYGAMCIQCSVILLALTYISYNIACHRICKPMAFFGVTIVSGLLLFLFVCIEFGAWFTWNISSETDALAYLIHKYSWATHFEHMMKLATVGFKGFFTTVDQADIHSIHLFQKFVGVVLGATAIPWTAGAVKEVLFPRAANSHK